MVYWRKLQVQEWIIKMLTMSLAEEGEDNSSFRRGDTRGTVFLAEWPLRIGFVNIRPSLQMVFMCGCRSLQEETLGLKGERQSVQWKSAPWSQEPFAAPTLNYFSPEDWNASSQGRNLPQFRETGQFYFHLMLCTEKKNVMILWAEHGEIVLEPGAAPPGTD